MPALYRKYRPQNFADVVGQKHIVQTLKNAVQNGNVAHAYLFCGGRGVGKTSLARILAKAVNCIEPKDGEACNKCKMCLSAGEGAFLDLVEIDAASNTGVENIRELIDHARFRPSLGKFKVFIIDEVHMLSRGAFNALLKTLEEPPEHVIFILATTEIHKVPATIISRTQRFDFSQLTVADIQSALQEIVKKEKFKVVPEALKLIAQRADGSMRDALSILDKVFTLGQNFALEEIQQLLGLSDITACVKLFDIILAQDAKAVIANFDKLAASGTDFEVFNKDFLEYLRKVLVFKLTAQSHGFGLAEENLQSLTVQAEKTSAGELMRVIRLFLRSYKESADSPSPELPMLLSSLEVFVKAGMTANQESRITNHEFKKVNKTVSKQESESIDPNSKFVIHNSTPEIVSTAKIETAAETTEPVDLSKVTDHWAEILAEIKKINNPLATMVKNCIISPAEGDKLWFEVKYLFDKENIESIKNSGIIRQAIEKVTGHKVRIGGKIVKREPVAVDTGASLADALTVFGGELVE